MHCSSRFCHQNESTPFLRTNEALLGHDAPVADGDLDFGLGQPLDGILQALAQQPWCMHRVAGDSSQTTSEEWRYNFHTDQSKQPGVVESVDSELGNAVALSHRLNHITKT